MRLKCIVVLAGLLVLTACGAHLPPRQLALNTAATTNKAVALVQDLEAQVCWGQSSAPAAKLAGLNLTECSTTLAAQVGLTKEIHQGFNRQVDALFGMHLKMSQELRLWTTGLPVPVSVQEFADAASGLSKYLERLTGNNPKVKAILQQAQALLQSGLRIIAALKEAK